MFQPPTAPADAPSRRSLPYQSQGGDRFIDLAVPPVNPGNIPATSIPAKQDDATRERAFKHRQHIVTIDPELLACEPFRFYTQFGPMLRLLNRAGTATYGHALPAGKRITISYQLDSRPGRISSIQQPAKIGFGRAKGRKL
jgi:hypothetical protein